MTTKSRSEEPKAAEPAAASAKADEAKAAKADEAKTAKVAEDKAAAEAKAAEKQAVPTGGASRGGEVVGGGETSATTRGGKTETKVERTPEGAAAPPSTCVVDDGTRHTGNATPGSVVCSAHAMHYQPDGTPREENRPVQSGREEVRR